MTDRANAPRIGALVPIRLASERLPMKAFASLGGERVFERLITQIAACAFVQRPDIVICTTTDSEDDPLEAVTRTSGVSLFRGNRDDIVDRLCRAREKYGFEIVLQVDGDDPLVDPGYMSRAIDVLLTDAKADVVVMDGLPLGIASKAMRARAFQIVGAAYRTAQNDTGFGYFFTKSGLCEVRSVAADPEDRHPTARLTLDYPDDLEFFRRVVGALRHDGNAIRVRDIVSLLSAQPELVQINVGRSDEYWRRTAEKTFLEFADQNGQVKRLTV